MALSLRNLSICISVFLACGIGLCSFGQSAPIAPRGKALKALTDSLVSQLNRYYVDRDAAARMGAAIMKHQRSGRYDKITDVHELAGQLTTDLLDVHRDQHLHVEYNSAIAYELSGMVEDVPGMVADKLQRERTKNFGFRKAEILSGNIGYLEISGFSRFNQFSKSSADAALSFLSNASALIIDLRYGSGGSPEMMTYLLGRFYKEKVHVSDIYIRSENSTLSFYTSPDSAMPALHKIPLYVLTSYKTFSAAEGFAYSLQRTKRATLVGENTRGGAHTVTYRPLGSGFVCDIPFGKAIDPLSKSNWEGTGIAPDLAAPAEQAVLAAAEHFFHNAIAAANDSTARQSLRLQRDLLLSTREPTQEDSSKLKNMAGQFGAYCLSWSNGCLYYQKSGKARYALLPLRDNSMRLRGSDEFIVQFDRDKEGRVNKISTVYNDGRIEHAVRTK